MGLFKFKNILICKKPFEFITVVSLKVLINAVEKQTLDTPLLYFQQTTFFLPFSNLIVAFFIILQS